MTLQHALEVWSKELKISIESGDVLLIEGKWYVTHSGLLRLARRKKCSGIYIADFWPAVVPICWLWWLFLSRASRVE
jgi:hypothetical protein